jgi:hypothetical protein
MVVGCRMAGSVASGVRHAGQRHAGPLHGGVARALDGARLVAAVGEEGRRAELAV